MLLADRQTNVGTLSVLCFHHIGFALISVITRLPVHCTYGHIVSDLVIYSPGNDVAQDANCSYSNSCNAKEEDLQTYLVYHLKSNFQ